MALDKEYIDLNKYLRDVLYSLELLEERVKKEDKEKKEKYKKLNFLSMAVKEMYKHSLGLARENNIYLDLYGKLDPKIYEGYNSLGYKRNKS